MTLPTSIDSVTEADLQHLVSEQVPEGAQLEYKTEPPDDQELRADVASLANSSGGHLVIGIREEQRVAVEVVGVDVEDAESEALRLEQVLRSRIAPQLPGVHVAPVPLASGRWCFVICVPRSWAAPHGVQSKSGATWRFVARGSLCKYDLDFGQIRAAFLGAADLPARLRELHRDQVNAALAGDTPVPLRDEPLTILTVTPLTVAAGTPQPIDLAGTEPSMPSPLSAHHLNSRWNLEGIYRVNPSGRRDEPDWGTVQMHRDGRVVFVDAWMLRDRGEVGPELAGVAWPAAIREGLAKTLSWMGTAEVAPPVVVQITLARVGGLALAVSRHSPRPPGVLTRDVVELPAVTLDELRLPDDGAAGMGTIFDTLWQAFGVPSAPRGDRLFGP